MDTNTHTDRQAACLWFLVKYDICELWFLVKYDFSRIHLATILMLLREIVVGGGGGFVKFKNKYIWLSLIEINF